MSFVDHIRACNNYDRARVVPVFAVAPERVDLVAGGDVDAVSAAVDEVVEALVVENRVPKWRNETFDVMPNWGETPLFRLDRGAVPFFGVRAYGVDLNGYRRDRGGLHF